MTELFGRLAPGVTLEQARAELRTDYAAMVSAHPEAYRASGHYQIDAVLLRDQITSGAKTVLWVLLAASRTDLHHRVLERRQSDSGALGAPRRRAGDSRRAGRKSREHCGAPCWRKACCCAGRARCWAC